MEIKDLQVGDRVIRMLAGKIPMNMIVSKVEKGVITCVMNLKERKEAIGGAIRIAKMLGANEEDINRLENEPPYWTFDVVTGAEIDTDLGWDGKTTTGSYLKLGI